MKVRFFGSNQCESCINLYVTLSKYQIYFEYIDAFDEREEVQDICDLYNVGELPHLQFIDDNDIIIVEHIGEIDEKEFMKYITDYFPEY